MKTCQTGLLLRIPRIAGFALFLLLVCRQTAHTTSPSPADTPRPIILSAAEFDYPPFSIALPDGPPDGFSIELLRAVVASMGRDITFRTGQWSDVKAWLEEGEVAVLPLVGRTPEREAVFDFTFPYMSLHGAIVVRDDTQSIHNLRDLKDKHVAVMAGDNAHEFLMREDRGIIVHPTTSFKDALSELSQGSYDAVFVQRLVALRLIQENKFANLRVIDTPVIEFRQDFSFAVREGDKDTLALLNEGLSSVMADGTFRRLHAKWFASMELPSHRRIVVGGDYDYPPYEFLNDKGQPDGYNVDLTRAIAKAAGIEIDIQLGPWSEIIQSLESGEIDILQGMFYSSDRDLKFDFTQPHSINHYVSVVRQDSGDPPETLDDLKSKKIVLQRSDIMHDFALKQGLDQIVAVDSQEIALRKLASGEFDCALVARMTAVYCIEKYRWDHLVLAKTPFLSPEYCYAAPNNKQALLSQFGEGLKILVENGEYRRIQKTWMGVYTQAPLTLMVALRYTAFILIPLLIILLTFFVWSWTLRRQVSRRTFELHRSEEFQKAIIRCSPVALYSIDMNGVVLSWNTSAERVLGWRAEDVIGKPLPIIPDEQREEFERFRRIVLSGQVLTGTEVIRRKKDGSVFPASLSTAPIYTTGDRIIGIMGAIEDLSDRKRAETDKYNLQQQLLHAQKLESVGRLAGGVAHDINNMLCVIIGYVEIALESIDPDEPLHHDLQEIMNAATRSAEVIRKLLAFARKQTIAPIVMDLNETVESMLRMLKRLIGEDIDLVWCPMSGVWPVKMDPAQIDQILANLCINSRDAISGVGKITIETGMIEFDEGYCELHAGFTVGEYVLLAVSDDGCGMDKNTRENAFEPFFSTKELGQGTGLGLATVYGIVRQNNGFINIYSEPGKGTTIRMYLPRFSGAVTEPKPVHEQDIPRGRGEFILLVEDEAAILKVGKLMLEKLGYRVVVASTPEKALELASHHVNGIDVLLTDVIMPEMNGRDLALRLRERHPDMKVLFMSGYTANVIAHRGVLDEGVHFIQKPFSLSDLAEKLRSVLT